MKKIIYIIGFILIVIGLYENMNRMSDSKDKVLHIWVSREEYDVLKEVNPIFESLHQAQIKMQIVSSEQAYAPIIYRIFRISRCDYRISYVDFRIGL